MSDASRSIGCLEVEADRQALAETIGADGFSLLAALEDPATPAWLREVPALEILRRVWIQQFYAPTGPVQWREPR
jgi:hypothetical protein